MCIRDRFYDIGEPFKITDVYKLLNNIPSVLDVKDVLVEPIIGTAYSDFSLDYETLISRDGRRLIPPNDVVFEIKYPLSDIDGEVL